MVKNAHARKNKEDFGEVKRIKVECVSETGWFDNSIRGKDVKAGGGIYTSQYEIAYNEENLGGYAALIEVEALDGKITKYLLDNAFPHTGERILTQPDTLYKLQDGAAVVFFDTPTTLRVRGENLELRNPSPA